MAFSTNRFRRLPGLSLAVVLAGGVVGCTSDGSISSPSSELDPPTTDPASVCLAATANTEIAVVELDLGFSGDTTTYAADRLRVAISPKAAAEVSQELAAHGMCLTEVDADGGWTTVRLTPDVGLEEALGQLDTVAGITGVRLDPVFFGSGGNGHHKGKGKGHHKGHGNYGHKGCGTSEDPTPGTVSLWHLAALRLGPALKDQPHANGITVAVLDTGLNASGGFGEAPGLESTNVAAGYDFINSDNVPADDDGHGTMIAGILASQGDFPGVAPGVNILPVKVLDSARSGTESALVDGINYAVAQGVDIISMSLAFPPGYIPSYELSQAVYEAQAAGVVLVGAAGNHGTGEVGYPAAFGEVIAVSGGRMAETFKAVDAEAALKVKGRNYASKMAKADYSGWGANIDVLAPGGSLEHDLDGNEQPDAIPTVGFVGPIADYDGYFMAGTSPATAQVAGVAALLLAAGADPSEVRPYMYGDSSDVGPNGFDIFAGAGVVDARGTMKRLKKGQSPTQAKVFANPLLTIAEDGSGNRYGVAAVQIIDEENNPVVGSRVYGHFRGPVAHAVVGVTDEQGRVLMVSEPVAGTADLFEFGVDKVITCLDDEEGCEKSSSCDDELILIPGSYAQFEAQTFRFFSAFNPGGVGIEPTPFTFSIPTDQLSAIVSDFALSATPGAPSTQDPVDTIPADFAQFTFADSLYVRSFGSGGSNAPVVYAIDRGVLASNCAIADNAIPVPVDGGGIEPTPFRIGDPLAEFPAGFDQVTTRSDGGLFLNGQPTTEAGLGLLTGTTGTVLISVDGSVCVPQAHDVNNLDVFGAGVRTGTLNVHGFNYTGNADATSPVPSTLSINDTTLHRAVATGLVSSTAMGASSQASAAVDGVQKP